MINPGFVPNLNIFPEFKGSSPTFKADTAVGSASVDFGGRINLIAGFWIKIMSQYLAAQDYLGRYYSGKIFVLAKM